MEKRIPLFVFLRTNGKKFSTYLRKICLFISSNVLESKEATKEIKIQGIIKRAIIALKRISKYKKLRDVEYKMHS